jgi:hypothetical protein
MQRALSPSQMSENDIFSNCIASTETLSLNCNFEDDEPNDKIKDTWMLGLDFFWTKLVEHFDIMWKSNEVMWLQQHRFRSH